MRAGRPARQVKLEGLMALLQHTQKVLLDHEEPLGKTGILAPLVFYKLFTLETKEMGSDGDGTFVVPQVCVPLSCLSPANTKYTWFT